MKKLKLTHKEKIRTEIGTMDIQNFFAGTRSPDKSDFWCWGIFHVYVRDILFLIGPYFNGSYAPILKNCRRMIYKLWNFLLIARN